MADFSQEKKYNNLWQSSKFQNVAFSGGNISQFINDVGYVTHAESPTVDTGSLVTTSSFNHYTGSLTSQFAGTASLSQNVTNAAFYYTETERNSLSTPFSGSLIYNTTRDRFEFYEPFWGWHPVALTPSAMRDWGFEAIEDFVNTSATWNWANAAINSGTVASPEAFSIIELNTGINTNGGYRYNTNGATLLFGTDAWRSQAIVRIPTNSDGTDTFQVLYGFLDTFAAVNQVDGAYFLYDSQGVSTGSTASGNWQIVTTSNSVRTFTTTAVAIDNANLQKLRIDVNSSGTEVNFYIDEILVGTHTTNIPTASGRRFGNGLYLQKSAGITPRTVDVDFLYIKTKFTTPR